MRVTVLHPHSSTLFPYTTLFRSQAGAADINVLALTAGKAVLVIDGGKPRTLAVGQTSPEKVKLISASSEEAVVEVGGQRRSEEHTSELQSQSNLVCRLLLEKKHS